jgi:glyceraldehyde 3-phosphate dehydrogenase
MIKIAINGFGRIGRNTVRALFENTEYGKEFKLVAINDLSNIKSMTDTPRPKGEGSYLLLNSDCGCSAFSLFNNAQRRLNAFSLLNLTRD